MLRYAHLLCSKRRRWWVRCGTTRARYRKTRSPGKARGLWSPATLLRPCRRAGRLATPGSQTFESRRRDPRRARSLTEWAPSDTSGRISGQGGLVRIIWRVSRRPLSSEFSLQWFEDMKRRVTGKWGTSERRVRGFAVGRHQARQLENVCLYMRHPNVGKSVLGDLQPRSQPRVTARSGGGLARKSARHIYRAGWRGQGGHVAGCQSRRPAARRTSGQAVPCVGQDAPTGSPSPSGPAAQSNPISK